ncbi:MAG: hypothetical protein GY786_17125 [Proteobacteria bacterium]|nr:hypothetical protein [Pseudomonadota bacterium]
MPISAIDNFERTRMESQNEASEIDKRGKINRGDEEEDGSTETPEKRVWVRKLDNS